MAFFLLKNFLQQNCYVLRGFPNYLRDNAVTKAGQKRDSTEYQLIMKSGFAAVRWLSE
jgi:hypothetical protein